MNIYEAYLGCLLIDPEVFTKYPVSRDEMCAQYRSLFTVIVDKIIANEKFDVVTLAKEYAKEPWFCGSITLSSFLDVPSVHMAKEYAEQIKIVAKKEKINSILANYGEFNVKSTPEETLSGLQSDLITLFGEDNKPPFKHIAQVLEENKNNFEITGLKTDSLLDNYWLLNNSGMHVIAASTNVGKTSLSVWLACRLLFNGHKCLFVSTEMGEKEMANKFKTVMADEISNQDLYLTCKGGISMEEIILTARLLKKSKGLDVLFIDYLQQVTTKERLQSREQYVAHVSRNIKALAMDLNIPVIVCAQLNRGMEATKEKRPTLSNLRESGSIEQDADSVSFLYRSDYYYSMLCQETPLDQQGLVEFTIAKQRNKPTANLKCSWDKKTNIWSNWQESKYQPKVVDACKVYGGYNEN
jgi:replicative DNA helicase